MSVIIRLQNLPWSANALDIRQFFKGLSIPEGGVHIVGGEMGDAFIAFSTDEDARQAMMHDRERIQEIQVRLLLSSRAEMQKVIESARLQSLNILQETAARTEAGISLKSSTVATANIETKQSAGQPATTAINIGKKQQSSLLTYQKQHGTIMSGSPISHEDDSTNTKMADDFIDLIDYHGTHESREKRRSSKDSHRSRRDRSNRSCSRGRDPERTKRKRDHDPRTRYCSRSPDGREKIHEPSKIYKYSFSADSKERDSNRKLNRETAPLLDDLSPSKSDEGKSKANELLASWGLTPMSVYHTNQYRTTQSNSYSTSSRTDNEITMPFEGVETFSRNSPEVATSAVKNNAISSTNNNCISLFGSTGGSGGSNSNSSDSVKRFVFQNPYSTAAQKINAEASETADHGMSTLTTPSTTDTASNFQPLSQEDITFAKTNPYEKMYPNLFAQAAAQSMPRSNATAAQRTSLPVYRDTEPIAYPNSSSIKVSNMCTSTNYSDLRKFFAGLFIPHNGIKMVNDAHGLRIGVAFIQFSRQPSVVKALTRNQIILKGKPIKIEVVPDEVFSEAEDSYRPSSRFVRQSDRSNEAENERQCDDGNHSTAGDQRSSFNKSDEKPKEPYTVLFVEDLPSLTTEQDIMKMFSSYTLYDILLMPSIDNRREYVAYVKFSRSEDAKAAYDDKSKHLIGHRIVHVRPGKEEHLENAKEKLRLANEQLLKEEQAEELVVARNMTRSINKKNEKSSRDVEASAFVDLSGENFSGTSSPASVSGSGRNALRDPRLIPSLFDMPTTIPEYNSVGENTKASLSPADPRLRTRERLSCFGSDPMAIPFNNTNHNSSKIFDEDIGNSNNNANMYPLDTYNNRLVPNNANNNSSNNYFNGGGNEIGNFNDISRYQRQQISPMEESLVLLYNCPYNIRSNDIADLFNSANLQVKHVEMLTNERCLPSGEFIVEVSSSREAHIAIKNFHNIQFHGRTLRIRHINPQEVANRLRKPFMNYLPGGGGENGNGNDGYGYKNTGSGICMNFSGTRQNNRDGDMNYNGAAFGCGDGNGNSPITRKRSMQSNGHSVVRGGRSKFDDGTDVDNDRSICAGGASSGGGHSREKNMCGIPEKFNRPNCVLAMENVPYKADLRDILRFFGKYDLRPDDIIRRFNDEGAPTGDARVAFQSSDDTREAYKKLNRKQILNRTIFLQVL